MERVQRRGTRRSITGSLGLGLDGKLMDDPSDDDDGWSDKWALDASHLSNTDLGKDDDDIPDSIHAERARKKSTRLAFGALFGSAIIFGLMTFFFYRFAQEEEFEAAFEAYARETATIAERNAEMAFGQLKVFASAITSVVVEDKTKNFPYVTMSHFDLRTQEIADLTGIEMIAFVPFVPPERKSTWERFQVYSQEWILEDYAYRGWNTSGLEPIPTEIHPYNLPEDYFNDTRWGFVDDNGFMEEILANYTNTQHGTTFVLDNTDSGGLHMEAIQVNSTHPKICTPIAQYGPRLINTSGIMLDLFTHPIFKKEFIASLEYNVPVISEVEDLDFLLQYLQPPDYTTTTNTTTDSKSGEGWDDSLLRSFTLHQVKEDFHNDSKTVGYVIGIIPWNYFFQNLLPPSVNGMVVTVASDCGSIFTYVANGGKPDVAQMGDHHDTRYDDMQYTSPFFWKDHPNGTSRHCHFDLHIYPSDEFRNDYRNAQPAIIALVVVAVFGVAAIVLWLYDKRQKSMQYEFIEAKTQAEALVMDLFPKFVGRRLMAEHANNLTVGKSVNGGTNPNNAGGNNGRQKGRLRRSARYGGATESLRQSSSRGTHSQRGSAVLRPSNSMRLSDYLSGDMVSSKSLRSKPLADLFPFATILFADIVGFTAWSSVREPSQVFILLETLYQNFDKIAKRRKIFKVETIGDCYVAVAGLPEQRRDHAPAMAMFAKECLEKFMELVETLEVELGPDTAELGLRTGLHSGPVTAGVLRGERARFQLFGDTVNTTARIESTGEKNRIHLSEECGAELRKFGKGEWVVNRKDKVSAKGKGVLSTCWLTVGEDSVEDISEDDLSEEDSDVSEEFVNEANDGEEKALPIGSVMKLTNGVPAQSKRMVKGAQSKRLMTRGRSKRLGGSRGKSVMELLDEKNQRLIEWNTETLKHLLDAIVARRSLTSKSSTPFAPLPDEEEIDKKLREGRMVFDEVAEIINLPNYDQAKALSDSNMGPTEVTDLIVGQIRKYVSTIAKLYPDNPFHNFDHASHVAMSVSKLLSRIVAPKMDKVGGPAKELQKRIHDHTYGITSDPLTQFACVFSSLIHDCEHDGVPNAQLVKEEHDLCARYKNISVAEQNSVDVAWEILMQPHYKELRTAIYSTEAEMVRFRQLVVNSVMATDIVDKNLKELRNARWEKAFQNSKGHVDNQDDVNRKATVVIEHLIQASDVSHTMQHWHIFRKWNENLFREMYTAYKAGRSEKDPSEFWYKGEIGFFDFYIIPLAKKLKNCGVFGVSSDEYLNYAQSNRREWEQKGEDIVKEYIEKYTKDYRTRRKSQLIERQLTRQASKIVLGSCNSLHSSFNASEKSLGSTQHSLPSLLSVSSSNSPKRSPRPPARPGSESKRVSFGLLAPPIEELDHSD